MALDPRDHVHKLQIIAGTNGRLKGHAFEQELSRQLNELGLSGKYSPRLACQGHIFSGPPANLLLDYVFARLSLPAPCEVSSFWLGGLATSGSGDQIMDSLTGGVVKRSKSDIVLKFRSTAGDTFVGVSVKTCFKPKPTNAQLFCSTASAFCGMIQRVGVPISEHVLTGLKMFCGDVGHRPLDLLDVKNRKADPERFFFEELPAQSKLHIANVFSDHQNDITRALLQLAYGDDPFPPQFVIHQTSFIPQNDLEFAIFSIDELISLSAKYSGFGVKEYRIKKGRYKHDDSIHLAPRFGCIQFQRLGNKQNATQLQFNLEAGYFYKITS